MTFDGVPAQSAPGPVPRAPRRRRLLVAVTTVWAALVVVLAVYAVHQGGATVRTQSSVAHALPTVDRALSEVIAAAASAGAVAEVGGYREVTAQCSITAVRDGARYERTARLYVPVGQERALLDGIAAKLPHDYDARVRKSGDYPFTADAGDFVALQGRPVGPGEVRFTADTGCRPLTGPVSEAAPSAAAPTQVPVQAVLATLKVTQVRWQTHRVECVRGGSVRTVQAAGAAGNAPPALVDALRAVSSDALVARPDLYVYRSGPVGVVVRTREGVVTVSATTGCDAQ
ncbi:hypothetical protein HC028_04000 [Planosporangium flavigriseum]|uniref:Uncharacterized protein n=1 Tax=Planosporangium flavigriseum TaxID=373681 RepID=A0A8J3PJJ9_9ACTN|nr:hypothetical protein [Planosporangium flavigriseum]NJC63674.1 hypothetical protein [Planosporangium flavigriseum]GIG72376.1 hypothetical protein Pfl04_07800 [Planosporangium flavigriseum]